MVREPCPLESTKSLKLRKAYTKDVYDKTRRHSSARALSTAFIFTFHVSLVAGRRGEREREARAPGSGR